MSLMFHYQCEKELNNRPAFHCRHLYKNVVYPVPQRKVTQHKRSFTQPSCFAAHTSDPFRGIFNKQYPAGRAPKGAMGSAMDKACLHQKNVE